MIPSTASAFISYELEPLELQSAYTFSAVQLAGIQNLIAQAAEEVLQIPLDVIDTSIPDIKKRAYLQGQIYILRHLLSLNATFSAPNS